MHWLGVRSRGTAPAVLQVAKARAKSEESDALPLKVTIHRQTKGCLATQSGQPDFRLIEKSEQPQRAYRLLAGVMYLQSSALVCCEPRCGDQLRLCAGRCRTACSASTLVP
jgi:hypothetical protein